MVHGFKTWFFLSFSLSLSVSVTVSVSLPAPSSSLSLFLMPAHFLRPAPIFLLLSLKTDPLKKKIIDLFLYSHRPFIFIVYPKLCVCVCASFAESRVFKDRSLNFFIFLSSILVPRLHTDSFVERTIWLRKEAEIQFGDYHKSL